MLDFNEITACIVWFVGCNMSCIYCYNTQIATSEGKISNEEFNKFLKSRIGKLDGVVFSGGECTLCEDFLDLAKDVKRLGFLLKVDTNGSNPSVIKKAIELNLIDFIALDFKTKYFKFDPNPYVMHYTIDNMTNSFYIKKFKLVYIYIMIILKYY